MLEETLESPLDCKEIQPVHPKGDQSWTFIRRTDAAVEAPVLWPHDAKSQLIGKDPDAGEDWRQEENWATENEVVEWYHWLNRDEFKQALGVGEGQEILVCCRPWGRKESDTTEQLNNSKEEKLWRIITTSIKCDVMGEMHMKEERGVKVIKTWSSSFLWCDRQLILRYWACETNQL